MSRRPVTLSSSIGMEMVLPIMLESWKSAKMAWSIPWRVTPGMPAVEDSILWEVVLSLDMACPLTEKERLGGLHLQASL